MSAEWLAPAPGTPSAAPHDHLTGALGEVPVQRTACETREGLGVEARGSGSRPVADARHHLATGAIGLQQVLFQSVTAIGPAAAIAFSIAIAAAYAGGALVLSVIVAMIGCLFVASCIGQLSKHLPSAGGLYAYTAKGLHPTVGFLVGWEFSMILALSAPVSYLLLGNLLGGVFASEFGWSFGVTWVVVAIVCAVATVVLTSSASRPAPRRA